MSTVAVYLFPRELKKEKRQFGSLGSCRGPGRQRTQTLVLCFLGLSARFGRPGRPGVNQV